MRFLSAPQIFTCSQKGILHHAIIIVDDSYTIIEIIESENGHEIPKDKIEHFKGDLTPGFINAHCHLELSYLKDKIDTKIGLDAFIKQVEINKSADIELIENAAYIADAHMYENCIVAVGDICNTAHTISIKKESKIYYHNFIETYSFDPNKAKLAFDKAHLIQQEFSAQQLVASISPHAPYSVSYPLMDLINEDLLHSKDKAILTIHNQESEAENDFFKYKTGPLIERLKHFGISTDHFQATRKNSLPSIMPHFDSKHQFILVHNTVSQASDIQWMKDYAKNVYWCFCPKANLYIENKLPKFELFDQAHCPFVIGTDSLASNNTLNILEEIKTIQSHSENFELKILLEAACINGAKALNIEGKFGSIEVGKQPGINEISENLSSVKKIV
jgi:aminodeoxyfutalosine deaminase